MQNCSNQIFENFLNKIEKQFLSCYPLHCILWQEVPRDLSWEQQQMLVEKTFNSRLNKNLPIKLSYQLNFLKKLILILEENCLEVHDTVYEAFCHIQKNLSNDSTANFAFKHYILKPGIHVSLRESKTFVTGGTTGLCSWQASLALADFLIEHPSLIRKKHILELGAGAGLCGLTILKLCHPKHLLLSDGSSSCVELMFDGLKRNFPEAVEENQRFIIDNNQTVECIIVPWESIEEIREISLFKPEILLAADVVYDNSSFQELSSAIDYLFNLRENKVQMYLAVTVRNILTLNGFLNIIGTLKFQVCECEVVSLENSNLFWDRSTPVKILKLTRN